MESNSVCHHTSGNKITISLSRERLQTELDDTVLVPINHKKSQFPRKEEQPSYEKKGKFALKY